MKFKNAITASVAILMVLVYTVPAFADQSVTCWFPPGWKTKGKLAKSISTSLSRHSGIAIKPRIAKSYPDILKAFSADELSLVYVGSFVQAIIQARGLGTPLVQNINGKDLYSGVMVYPKGDDPESILADYPDRIAYAVGASSGESSAKAATAGKAAMGVASHGVAASAVKAGKAKAAIVKNWWWDKNRQKFSMLGMYKVPEVSIEKNPDNVLTASSKMPPAMMAKITEAAIAQKDAFGAQEMVAFDRSRISFSLNLMAKGGINPLTYAW